VPRFNGSPSEHPGGQITAANGLVRYLEESNERVIVLNTASPSFPPPPLRRKLLQAMGRVARTLRLLLNREIEAMIAFTGAGLSLVERLAECLLCRVWRVPCVLFFRNSDILDSRMGSVRRRILGWTLRIPTRIAVQGARWIEALEQMGVPGNRITVVPNWIPPDVPVIEQARKGTPDRPIQFLFVGWLIESKGILTILDAIEILGPKREFGFTIIGGGRLEEKLRQRVTLIGGNSNIEVTGWQPAEMVRANMISAHVFVLPTYHNEGFPNALLEAMSMGMPAIGTSAGAIRDSLKHNENGFLIPARNAEALAAAMERYIAEPGLLPQHSAAALETVRHRHDWARNCGRVRELLHREA